jgi:hypothetical protein
MGFYMRVKGRLKGSPLLGLNIPTNRMRGALTVLSMFHHFIPTREGRGYIFIGW